MLPCRPADGLDFREHLRLDGRQPVPGGMVPVDIVAQQPIGGQHRQAIEEDGVAAAPLFGNHHRWLFRRLKGLPGVGALLAMPGNPVDHFFVKGPGGGNVGDLGAKTSHQLLGETALAAACPAGHQYNPSHATPCRYKAVPSQVLH